ncbi:MAG: 50S ribosomal protein L17 [Sneathiellaceae bacterium]
MRHRNAHRKLSRRTQHRLSMFGNMAASLIKHEQIQTTVPKAKELKPIVDRLISLGKRGDLHARRQALARLPEKAAVDKLFDTLAGRYADRSGGYCRIVKSGFRKGDMAPMAVLELIDRDPTAKGQDSGPVDQGEDEAQAA